MTTVTDVKGYFLAGKKNLPTLQPYWVRGYSRIECSSLISIWSVIFTIIDPLLDQWGLGLNTNNGVIRYYSISEWVTHSLRLPVHTGEHVQYDLERLQNQLTKKWTSEVAVVNESKANALKIFREIQRPAVKLENCKSFIFQSSMYRLARPSTALLWSASFDLLNQTGLQAQSCWDFSYVSS